MTHTGHRVDVKSMAAIGWLANISTAVAEFA
jgi:hypothetical protein